MQCRALLQTDKPGGIQNLCSPLHMCLLCSCLFILLVAREDQGIIHDPPPSAPYGEGETGNIPVKCQMFGRGLRTADGFGGETGNSSGAGKLESQTFAE